MNCASCDKRLEYGTGVSLTKGRAVHLACIKAVTGTKVVLRVDKHPQV